LKQTFQTILVNFEEKYKEKKDLTFAKYEMAYSPVLILASSAET